MGQLTPKYDTCFFERYAMATLAVMMGEPYTHLVNRDRPDLQDNNLGIGIEVTRAIRENKNVANALVNEMAGKDVMEVNGEDLCHISQSGYAYGLGDGNIIGKKEYEYWSLALPLKRILEIKMDKVNNGFYGDFEEFGLFVFAKEDLDKMQIRQTIDFVREKQSHQDRCYSKLFISQIQTLYACDLCSGRFKTIAVSRTRRRQFYESAIES